LGDDESQPLSTAATAWRTLPHMLPTKMLFRCNSSITPRHAQTGDEGVGTAAITALMPAST
jgi:hypothetical protein